MSYKFEKLEKRLFAKLQSLRASLKGGHTAREEQEEYRIDSNIPFQPIA